ncbi:MAG: D-alanyl-D-alanine carboxypeptidase [Defluviitaleaceae bacterium]|nr:D-alanyl-D-alanine carboxypeptidase [Defluviitaleaceae bacterium]MCL2273457.1 D-alanyl-D-alanine carboxypeptidase [Defluviitaleaceae bacterium]
MKTLHLLAFALTLAAIPITAYAEEDAPYEESALILPQPPPYTAGGVAVMCAETGLILYGNEHHTQFYPASVTKVMTALVVLDHVQDLSERFEFSYHSVFSIPRNSSHISMDVGETLSIYQALHGLMVRSANEVAIALAEYVAGSEEEFVTLMNRRAASLGAVNTVFKNPTGLPANGHVTTAYDMALIMREAVRRYPEIFTGIISTRQFAIPPTERQPDTRFLNTTNQLIRHGTPYYNPHVIGSKTGWTHAAGNTLVTYAQYNDRRLIVSILQGAGTDPFRETNALLNFAFRLPYEERIIFNAGSYKRIVPVYQEIDGEQTEIYRLILQADEDISHYLPITFDLTQLRFDLSVPQQLSAPVQEGDVLGNVAIYAQNVRLNNAQLRAQSTVEIQTPEAPAYDEEETVFVYLPDAFTEATTPTTPLNDLLENLRYSEQLEQLAVPLTVGFFGLFFTIIAFAARRKRKRKIRHDYSRYANVYRYRR